MFTLESTWSTPTAVALWGNSSSDDEIDTEEIRWLKQTYLWNDNDDVTNEEKINRESTSDSLHDSTREGTSISSRHACHYNTGQTPAEEESRPSNSRGNNRRHYKHRRKKKEILPPINTHMKHQNGVSEDIHSEFDIKPVCLPTLPVPSKENLDRTSTFDKEGLRSNSDDKSFKGSMSRKTYKQSNTKFKSKTSFLQGNGDNIKTKVLVPKLRRIPSVKRKSDKDAIVSCDQVVLDIISSDKYPSTNYNAPIHNRGFPDIAITNVQPQHKEAVKSKRTVIPKINVSSNKTLKEKLITSSKKIEGVGTDLKSDNKSKGNTFPDKNQKTSGNTNFLKNGGAANQTSSKSAILNKCGKVSTSTDKSGYQTMSSNLGGSSENRQTKRTPVFSYSQRFKNVKNKFVIRNGILSHIRFDEEESDSDIDEESGSSSSDDSDSEEEDNTESEDESNSSSISLGHNSASSDVNDSTDDEDEYITKSNSKKPVLNHSAKTFRNSSYRKPPTRVHLQSKTTISISKKTVKRNTTKSVKWAVKLVKIRYFQRDVRSSYSDSN